MVRNYVWGNCIYSIKFSFSKPWAHGSVAGKAPPKPADALRQAALSQSGEQQTWHSHTCTRTRSRGSMLFRWLSG